MARTVKEVMDGLSNERKARIEARAAQMETEVQSLRELRRLAKHSQAEVAAAMAIKQPSVSKIERQTDMFLSTLQAYVEALGGEVQLTVTLPGHAPLRLTSLEDLTGEGDETEAEVQATTVVPVRR